MEALSQPTLSLFFGVTNSLTTFEVRVSFDRRIASQMMQTFNGWYPSFPLSWRVYFGCKEPGAHRPQTDRPQWVQLWWRANIPNFVLQCMHFDRRGAGDWGEVISFNTCKSMLMSSSMSSGRTSSEPISSQNVSHLTGFRHLMFICAPCLTKRIAASISWW